jgi:hypothetical protein
MSYECIYCDFTAPTNTRLKRHLATQKHATNFEKHQLEVENTDIVPQIIEETKLCENIDCERYPPDWDFEEDTEENYEGGRQWVKCTLCDGYFNDDGLGDILFIEEEPHNKTAQCDLCGKDNDIVQMKGTGQFLCGNACDEEDSVGDDVEDEVKEENSEEDSVQEEDLATQIMLHLCSNTQMQKEEDEIDNWYSGLMKTNASEEGVQEDESEESVQEDESEESVQEDESEEESPYNLPTFIDNYEWLILDIKTKEMMKNINETLISHPFIMRVVNVFMNIVWFFTPFKGKI